MNVDGKVNKRKKYRRTKRVVSHPNLLFEKWLQEWQEEATLKNSKMKHHFQKARKSLRLFPLPLYSGKDCKLLTNFGDKICQMLDHRLQQHLQHNGPIDWDQIHKFRMVSPVKQVRKKTISAGTRTEVSAAAASYGSSSLACQKSKKNVREYVPVVRSGSYALLLALYHASEKEDSPGFLKKTELIEAAQPLCDASLVNTAEASHYSAWSSMSTLTRKNLARRDGNPSRYSITLEGKVLAARLLAAENNPSPVSPLPSWTSGENIRAASRTNSITTPAVSQANYQEVMEIAAGSNKHSEILSSLVSSSSCLVSSSSSVVNSSSVFKDALNSDVKTSKVVPSSSITVTTKMTKQSRPDCFKFSYITSLDIETPVKDHAVVAVEEDDFLGFLIKCSLPDLLSSGLCYRLDNSRDAPSGLTYAYLSNECAPELSPGLHSPSIPSSVTSNTDNLSVERKTFASSFTLSENISRGKAGNSTSSVKHGFSSQMLTSKKKDNVKDFSHFTFLPEEYDIVLCVDNAETTGGSTGGKRSTKDIIINELNRHGIKYSVRKLHVGDFVWVCQERHSPTSAHSTMTEQPRELVLPYIIERKRMDDLASSIKDGRFHEQKFRLKRCGLSKPLYLVEEYGSQNLSLPEATCLQAVVNTQIVDGFTVKVTKDQRESAAFLTIMTRCLQSKYQGKAVSSILHKDVESQREEMLDHDTTETSLMTFMQFNAASVKNHQLTVREMFAKHLLQIHGLSVDKVLPIVDQYGSPGLLVSAYERLKSDDATEQMLSSLKCGKSGRNLGPTLSTIIARLYTKQTIL
ncbi:crossover junction endonuclease MUS81 isoform X1 [Cherax quadricarinatus]